MAKPLEYGSLKAVFQYMNPILRLKLVAHCPRLTTVNEVVPLRISDLDITLNTINADNSFYRLSIIQQYHDGKTPNAVIQDNENNERITHDVDKYGFDKILDRTQYDLEEIQLLERRISDLENCPNSAKFCYVIEHFKNRLLAYQLRHNRQEPPYSFYLQLRTEINGIVTLERFEYNKSINEAMDYLVNKILNGPRKPVEINKFHLYSDRTFSENFRKMKVRSFCVRCRKMKADIIDYEQLNMIDLYWVSQVNDSLVKSSKLLILNTLSGFDPNCHPRVHFSFESGNIKYFLEKVKENPPTPGTHFSHAYDNKKDIKSIKKYLKKRRDSKQLFEERNDQFKIYIGLSDFTELCMYFGKTDEKSKEFCDKKWMLHAKVQSKNGL